MDEILGELVQIALSGPARATDPADRHAVKRLLLDSLGCALGASMERPPRIAQEVARSGSGESTVIATGARTTADLAAFANGAMVRFFDFNDTYASPGGVGHPSDYIPAVLAAAEDASAGPEAIFSGVVAAFEIFDRLTDATDLGVEGWDHVTSGAVASAAGAGLAWGFDAERLAHAMSLALVPNFALQATRLGELSMWKGCASANACRNGVFAARLAGHGLTGPGEPFRGRGGFDQAVGKPVGIEPLRAPRGSAVQSAHLKKYPVGFFGQGAIDAALELRGRVGAPDRIESVDIGTFEFGARVMAGDPAKWRPRTRESADHSIPYVVATGLVRGHVRVDDFGEDVLRDPDVLAMLDRIAVHADPECVRAWPATILTKIVASLADGGTVSARVEFHRGHARNPMSDAEVQAKFDELAGRALGERRRAALSRAVWELERLGSVRELLELARAA